MYALFSMLTAVLIWSLYPLAAAYGLQTMTSFEMIFIVYFFAGFGALLVAYYSLRSNNLLSKAWEIQKTLDKRAYIIIIVSGISGALCHSFFILSLTLANKSGVSLLYESWPIIAVIAAPFLMKKTWKDVSLKEFLISIVALIGVAIIILSDKEIQIFSSDSKILNETMNYHALGGYILAFVGAYLCAILVITKGAYSEYFRSLNDDMSTTFISEAVSRTISMILMTIIFILMKGQLEFSNIHWEASFFIGFMVFVVGGAFYTYSLLNSDNPTIQIIYYFVPVFAVVWLWIAGEASINSGLFIGGAIVLFSNLYLYHIGRKKDLLVQPSAQL